MLYEVILQSSFSLTAEVKLFIKHTQASELACGKRKHEQRANPASISIGRGPETALVLSACGRGRKEITESHEGGRLLMMSSCVIVPLVLERRGHFWDALGAAGV